jgi:Uncharacterized protein conserved in bacteria
MTTISMYSASVPVFTRLLKNLDAILDKAVVYADGKKIEHNTLLTARLAPDMLPLTKQVQIATDNAKGCVARLAGVEIPKYEDSETTFAELKARLAKTIAFIESIKPEQINGSEDKDIQMNFGPVKFEFKGLQYLLHFANFNVFFHVTTAYDILRHNGLDIGKRDFIGG